MYIKQLTNNEFNEFSKNFKPSSIYQTVEYAFTMSDQNFSTLLLGLISDNEIKAASLILIQKVNGFKYAYAPRGFLIDYNDTTLVKNFTNEIKNFLGKNEIVAVKINPMIIRHIYDDKFNVIGKNFGYDSIFNNLKSLGYHHLGYNNFFEALKPRFEAIIDLDKSCEALFMDIDKSFRTKLRNADNTGIKIHRGDETNLEYLYFQTKNKYPRDLKYFKDLYAFFHKNNLIDFYYSKLDTTVYLQKIQKQYEACELEINAINELLLNSQSQNKQKLIDKKIKLDRTFQNYKKLLTEAINYLKEYPNGIILSSALVIRWCGEVYLIMDGYDPKFKKFNAKHLMLWKLIGTYSQLGYKKLNLGGIIDTRNSEKYQDLNNKYKGLNEFKMKFGAKATEYIGDLELITNNALYFMYSNSSHFSNLFKRGK